MGVACSGMKDLRSPTIIEGSPSSGWEGEWVSMSAEDVAQTDNSPVKKEPLRSMHTASLVDESVYIFGGEEGDYGSMPRDLWRFNLRTQNWQVPVSPSQQFHMNF